MQRSGMHHKLSHSRREQDEDCKVGRFGAFDQIGEEQRYAGAEKCDRCVTRCSIGTLQA